MIVGKENKHVDLEEVKKVIRALLLSTKHGLTVNELCSEYTIVTSKILPYKELGYFSAIELVKDIPDVVRPIYQSDNLMILRGIADGSTAHISALVSGQKSVEQNSRIITPQHVLSNPTKQIVSSFIQAKIVALMKYYPSGLEISLFENAYILEYGKRLNPVLQGFTSIKKLLQSCSSDIIKLEYKEESINIFPAKHDKVVEKDTIPQREMINDNEIRSRSNISNELKKEIFSVLMRFIDGITASQFLFEFKNIHKKEIDFQALGFNSIVELMSKLPNIVDIDRFTQYSDWLLIPKTFIIDDNGCIIRKHIQYTIHSPGELDEQVEIYFSYITNPSLFCIQLAKNLSNLHGLLTDMNNFYHSIEITKYSLPTECIVPGQPCAALYNDNQWYRAVIKNILSPTEVTVFYVDYGDSLNVEISSLCILKTDFVALPCQAIVAKLNNIKPIGIRWSKAAVKKFFELTQDQKMFATIIDKKPVLLIDIRNSENCNLADVFQKEMILLSSEVQKETRILSEKPPSECQLPEVIPSSDLKYVLEFKENEKGYCLEDNESGKDFVFVKCLLISESYTLHIIHSEDDTPYVTSTEISGLFWDGDILKQMLRQKRLQINSKLLTCNENKELFSALIRYSVRGILDEKVVKPCITTYELSTLPTICSLFVSRYENAIILIQKEIQLWNSNIGEYWTKRKSGILIPEEENEEALQKLQALKHRRKELFLNLVTNTASTTILEEIKSIDQKISILESKHTYVD